MFQDESVGLAFTRGFGKNHFSALADVRLFVAGTALCVAAGQYQAKYHLSDQLSWREKRVVKDLCLVTINKIC